MILTNARAPALILPAQVLGALLAQNVLKPNQPNIPTLPGAASQFVQDRTIPSKPALNDAKNGEMTGTSSGQSTAPVNVQTRTKAKESAPGKGKVAATMAEWQIINIEEPHSSRSTSERASRAVNS